MEIIQIVIRSFLTLAPDGRTAICKKFSGRRVRNIKPIPVGAMDGDDASMSLGKSERKRNRFGMVFTTIELECYLS